jgi:uncharacterized protein (DUF2249 family)
VLFLLNLGYSKTQFIFTGDVQMETKVIELDVREDIKNGQDPFETIMSTISPFQSGDTLILHAPFQPVPLYGVLKSKGFGYETEEINEKYYKIKFTKNN